MKHDKNKYTAFNKCFWQSK